MNLIPKLAEMLGVEIGEEFKLKQTDGYLKAVKYRFRKISNQVQFERQCCSGWAMCSAEDLGLLVLGKYEIVKLPFEQKDGEMYYTVAWDREKIWCPDATWREYGEHYCRKYCGNVFRTEADAEKHKYEIYEKLTGKRWGDEQ